MNPAEGGPTSVQTVALALPLLLLLAWAFASIARWLLRGRAHLGLATSMVLAIGGTSLGLLVAGWIAPAAPLWSPLTLGLALAASVLGIAIHGAVAAHFQRPEHAGIAELLVRGESDRLEFKSTARVNLHTGKRDERMEHVIAKTCGAFLNADGGSLLIGVDDTGTPVGLEPDFATLKSADADRFELWVRDLLVTTLGQNAATRVRIDFATLPDADGNDALICRLTCLPSARPVYLRAGRNAPPELWVRIGNSSRQLTVDEAADYVMHRWPLNLWAALAAQAKAAVRFSEEH